MTSSISTTPSIQDDLNNGVVQRLGDLAREIDLGDLLAFLVAGSSPTEADVTVTGGAATLSVAPDIIFHVDVDTETGSTVEVGDTLELLIGGDDVEPLSGQVVWDQWTGLRVNTGDSITQINVWYGVGKEISLFTRRLSQQD